MAFFTLSLCEVGQFAYSEGTTKVIKETVKLDYGTHCYHEALATSELLARVAPPSYALPR